MLIESRPERTRRVYDFLENCR